jgi:hypothetical protein
VISFLPYLPLIHCIPTMRTSNCPALSGYPEIESSDKLRLSLLGECPE